MITYPDDGFLYQTETFCAVKLYYKHTSLLLLVGRVAQSVYRLTTCWTVRGSNLGGGARFSAPVQTGPGTHPASCTMGTDSFPGVKSGRVVTLTSHPLLAIPIPPYGPYGLYRPSVPVQYSYTSTPPMGCMACTEPQCLYSTAIPLLPLWAVRPVQTLSACTVQLYLYSPYGPYGLYRASVPVQYSYTSTPPMGRATCTEPQCLYNGALHLYLYLILFRAVIAIFALFTYKRYSCNWLTSCPFVLQFLRLRAF